MKPPNDRNANGAKAPKRTNTAPAGPPTRARPARLGRPRPAAIQRPTYSAPALDKGLDILEMLCANEHPLSQKAIAQGLGRSVGEIYRMLSCLVNRQYVAQLDDSHYAVTTRLFELAHQNPPTRRLLVEATPIMQRLSDELDQSCHLTVYSQGRQIVLTKVDSPGGMGFSVRTGAELDILVSASGRVLLAFQDPETRSLWINEALRRCPEHAQAGIEAELTAIEQRGHESMPSVQVRGLYAVSFPILNSQGRAMAALTVPYSERLDQLQRKTVAEATNALRIASVTLTTRVGGQPTRQRTR